MTLQQIVGEIFEGLGEPSDLQYLDLNGNLDTSLTGWRKIVDEVNIACLELVSWKFPNGRVVRFRQLEESTTFQSEVRTGTVLVGNIASAVITTDLALEADNFYGGWAIEIDGSIYRILQSRTNGTDTELFLSTLPLGDPLGKDVVVSKRDYLFIDNTGVAFGEWPIGIGYNPANGRPLELIEVADLETQATITQTPTQEPLLIPNLTFGVPTQFYKIAQGLRFDLWPESKRLYNVRYVRSPRMLSYTDSNVEPELPVQFHRAVVLHGLWWGYRRMQENNSAYSTKRDLDDLLARLRTEYDFQGDFTNHQITYSREGV